MKFHGHDHGLVHRPDATLFSSSKQDARWLVMSADKRIYKPYSFCLVRKTVLLPYGREGAACISRLDSYCVNRRKEMDGAESVCSNEFLTFPMQNTAMHIPRCLTVL